MIEKQTENARLIADDSVQQLENMIHAGNFSGALDYIETLPQDSRQNWKIQNLTGVVCAYCGQFQEAETFFTAALEQRPDDLDTMYNLADTYAALGKNQKAERLLRRCEQQDSAKELSEDIALLRKRLSEKPGRQVLMAAYYFPPLSGSGVFRSIKFAKYLPLFGWKPTVISTDRPPNGWNFADESLVKEIPADMEVIRIPDGISTGRETSISDERAQAVLGFLRDVLRHSPEAAQIYARMLQTKQGIVNMLTFPCAALSWAYDTVQYIRKNMDLDKFQIIYTTSGPSSAHLIGFYLKKKYGIPWVADYRDPWTFNAYGADYDPANARHRLLFELESVLLRQADHNLTVAASMIDSYTENFGIPSEKITGITNGYDEADFADISIPEKPAGKFTINYSGLLYSQQRSIAPVLKALQQLRNEKKIDLSNVLFRITGTADQRNIEAVKEYGLEEIMEHTGYLSHREALLANVNASLLLLLVGDEPKFKPVYTGKIFEYLRSGRPVLALAPKGGAVDQALRESGHGKAFLSTQIPKIKAMILREYQKWRSGKVYELLHSPQIEKFERRVLTEQLSEVFSKVVNSAVSLSVPDSEAPADRGLKYLVICNGGYPAIGNPRCMFAHERVLQYIKAGLDVDAFGFIWGASLQQYEYQGVKVTQGGAAELQKLLNSENYEKLLIHFVDVGVMYAIQQAGKLSMPMIVWCHGYEVLPWYRCWFNYTQKEITQNEVMLVQQDAAKKAFLQKVYSADNIHFIFVSAWQMERSKKFVGFLPKHHEVIHNYINYEFFASPAKKADDRFHILSIKNHATRMYANDLTAKAILELSHKNFFSQLTFELYGDGKLFQENYGDLLKRNFPNVHIHKNFLSHDKMRELFRQNGIFLSPTRMDSHQITTSEAMSAGMSVVTSSAGPIREFMNEECGSLFEFDNYWMMAEDIEYLYFHPEEFLRKSKNAVKRIREQCSYDATIKRELQLIERKEAKAEGHMETLPSAGKRIGKTKVANSAISPSGTDGEVPTSSELHKFS